MHFADFVVNIEREMEIRLPGRLRLHWRPGYTWLVGFFDCLSSDLFRVDSSFFVFVHSLIDHFRDEVGRLLMVQMVSPPSSLELSFTDGSPPGLSFDAQLVGWSLSLSSASLLSK